MNEPTQSKFVVAALLALSGGTASAFSPLMQSKSTGTAFTTTTSTSSSKTALFNGPNLGAGGMADTRDPDALVHEDPRKSISAAPSFEEYLKMRDGGGGAPAAAAAPAPAVAAAAAPFAAAPAPVAAAPAPAGGGGGGGTLVDTLASLEGPGQVWGAEGIAVGKEESDLRGYDNFGKFLERLQSTGVANEIAGAGPFTVFAPVDSAVVSYEKMFGPFDAAVCKLHIVKGLVPSSAVGTSPLPTLAGKDLVYKRAVRKDFVNDVVVGEKTFGPYNDFPIDVSCSNGVIHAVSLSLAA